MIEETRADRSLTIEHLDCRLDVTYNWGDEMTRKDLRDLYTKATKSQWISDEKAPLGHARGPTEGELSQRSSSPSMAATSTPKLAEKEKAVLRGEVLRGSPLAVLAR